MSQSSDTLKLTFQLTSHNERLEVRSEVSGGGQATSESVLPPQTLLNQLAKEDPTHIPSSVLETVGRTLYKSLVAGDVAKLTSEVLQEGARLRQPVQFELRFDPDQTSLAQYPWEIIANDLGQFLVRDGMVDVTRYITYPQRPPIFDPGLHDMLVLRVVSQPPKLQPFSVADLGLDEVETLQHITFEQLEHKLLIERMQLWGLQFHGHGALMQQCDKCDTMNWLDARNCDKCGVSLTGARRMGALAFERNGDVNWVSTQLLGSMLYNTTAQLVFLLSCETACIGDYLVFSGLAPGLILAGIPVVIGMQYGVGIDFANRFAHSFYQALFRNKDILNALRTARRMSLQGAWYSPVLYLRCQRSPEEIIKPVYHTRSIDTAVPTEAQAGLPFLVKLWIRRPETKPCTEIQLRKELDIPQHVPIDTGETAAEVKFEPVEGRKLRRGEVEVRLNSACCDVTPESKLLFVDEHLDASPAIFTVRAREIGRASLIFSVWQDGGQIASVPHHIQVISRNQQLVAVIETRSQFVPVEGVSQATYWPTKVTCLEVIEVFQGLNLLVTDDEQQIEAKGNELQAFYFRKKASPDPRQRSEADTWFKDLACLKAKRSELLGVVRAQFAHLADTTLEAALSSGTKELTPRLYAQLEQLALRECNCEPPLARSFVEDYLREKGISVRGTLVFPHLVERLVVAPSVGQVELSWRLPAEDCDEVIVKRFELTPDGKSEASERELCRGSLTNYLDREVEAGRRYHYEVYSIWQGVESQTRVTVEAVALGEVSDISRRWVQDHVELSWRPPSPDCQVFVFRAPSPMASARHGTPDPLPDHPQAELVFRGTASKCSDQNVTTGQEYHYLVVTSFAQGCFSSGVSISVRTPTLPPDVQSASAEYLGDGVNIRWEPVSSRSLVEYTVVQSVGASPAISPSEGKEVAITSATCCRDTGVENGREYTYTIFTRRDDLYSPHGCATKPVMVAADVYNLAVEEGDSSITLRWNRPPGAHTVVVRRSLSPITHPDQAAPGLPPNEGILVPLASPEVAYDTGLHNDQQYHYLIYCSYLLERGEVFSAGMQRTAIPRQLPGAITRFQATRDGNRVVCTWEMEGPGTVAVVRTRQPLSYRVDDTLTVDELSRLSPWLPPTRDNLATDDHPTPAEPYYTAFVVAGSYVRAGPGQMCDIMSDVSNLRLKVESEGVRLRWEWPESCLAVAIMRRQDEWPTGLDDPLAVRFDYSRTEYEQTYNSFLDKQPGAGKLYYIIYAQPSNAPERVFSSGLSPGCRGWVQQKPEAFGQLCYSLKARRRYWFFGPYGLWLEWRAEVRPDSFSGFVLVANAHNIPFRPDQGIELFRWTPKTSGNLPTEPQKIWIPLNKQQLQTPDQHFYCRIFHLIPDERERVRIVHPDKSRFEIK